MNQVIDLNHCWRHGESPLSVAVLSDNIVAAEILITHGADVNLFCTVQDLRYPDFIVTRKETPFITAARLGKLEIVQLMIQNGAVTNLKAIDSSMSAIHWACNRGHLNVVHYLVQHGANINMGGDYNFTPLLEAVVEGHLEITKVLTEWGADLNARTEENPETALLIAIVLNHSEIAEYLIQAGSDVTYSGNNLSCFDIVASSIIDGSSKITKMLVLAGANLSCDHIAQLCNTEYFDVELLSWMMNEKQTPASLMRQSRIYIRKHLMRICSDKEILSSISRLPLPKRLLEYLKLKHLY